MTEEELLITNTFLNSRRKTVQDPSKLPRRKKRAQKTLTWKENMSEEHVYSCSSVISPGQFTVLQQTKQRSDSLNIRKPEEVGKGIAGKILIAKQTMRADKATSILTEMNVTKKWTELREAWIKEKENVHQQPTCISHQILRFRGVLRLPSTSRRSSASTTVSRTKSTSSSRRRSPKKPSSRHK